MNHLKKLFWFSLIVKMILVAALPLTSDESYYWVWSRHMQLSYYDHPPFVAWLFWLGDFTRWFPGSVRWPGVLFGHLGLWLWLRALTPFLTVEQRVQWLWLALLSPLVGGTGLLVTPDLPLLVFYGLALWLFFLWQAAPSMGLSLVFGLALGLGFTSKYMMVLFVLSLLPLLAFSKTVRYGALKSAHWIALGGVLGATPVWLWNYMNDFASIKFQAAHGLDRVWKPSWTIHYVGAQVGIIFPIVLYWSLQARR
ncbi:MAG TPA: glycosyltransferase family 39 protein, partial [Bdellovibrionales bacterium]|nr:glycosyltransferase family 39 protein [Bdellovibrionales bacterium]